MHSDNSSLPILKEFVSLKNVYRLYSVDYLFSITFHLNLSLFFSVSGWARTAVWIWWPVIIYPSVSGPHWCGLTSPPWTRWQQLALTRQSSRPSSTSVLSSSTISPRPTPQADCLDSQDPLLPPCPPPRPYPAQPTHPSTLPSPSAQLSSPRPVLLPLLHSHPSRVYCLHCTRITRQRNNTRCEAEKDVAREQKWKRKEFLNEEGVEDVVFTEMT